MEYWLLALTTAGGVILADEIVNRGQEEEEKKAEVSLTELIRELIRGKREQKAKLIDVA
jgi:predicted O-methyltransferase YrrM